MGYPEGLPATAFCQMEGCDFHGGGRCINCGRRLRCGCGRFVTEATFDAHLEFDGCSVGAPLTGEGQ